MGSIAPMEEWRVFFQSDGDSGLRTATNGPASRGLECVRQGVIWQAWGHHRIA